MVGASSEGGSRPEGKVGEGQQGRWVRASREGGSRQVGEGGRGQ